MEQGIESVKIVGVRNELEEFGGGRLTVEEG